VHEASIVESLLETVAARALDRLPLEALDLLFVENVGNLVCPASFALGEHSCVVVLSTAEGEDKPLKYPAMFRKADALVLNKMDLAPYVSVDPAAVEAHARRVRPGLPAFRTSCVTGDGIEEWIGWISDCRPAWMQAS
jgi:hydrogenase nickel incorporation protein HypB